MKVLRVIDTGIYPIPTESGEIHKPEALPEPRKGLKPIQITQPEGVSFHLDGSEMSWQNWNFHIGFNGREGLTIQDRKSTRLNSVTNAQLVCRLLLDKKNKSTTKYKQNKYKTH